MTTPAGALLSPAAATPRSRTLRAWSAPDRARLAQAIAASVQEWRSAWGLERAMAAGASEDDGHDGAPVEGIECEAWLDAWVPATAPERSAWRPIDEAVSGLWWAPLACPAAKVRGALRARGTVVSALGRALFGDPGASGEGNVSSTASDEADPSPSLASEVVHAAWTDCCKRIAAAVPTTTTASAARGARFPTEDELRPWAGALVLKVPWWGHRLALLVSGGRVDSFLAADGAATTPRTAEGRRDGLTSIWQALARRVVRVHVQTRPFELELGALASIRVGDVLRTSHPLESPPVVSIACEDGRSDVAICEGYLGKVGASRAMELMPPLTTDALPAAERTATDHAA
jgi:hypothetical protein